MLRIVQDALANNERKHASFSQRYVRCGSDGLPAIILPSRDSNNVEVK